MSRDRNYQRLLNSKRWRELRADYLKAHPLCERCNREGFVRAAVDVHHRVPVETASKSVQAMERLCFDPHNLEALCVPCHVRTHKEAGSFTRETIKQRADDRLRRWIEKYKPKPNPESGQ